MSDKVLSTTIRNVGPIPMQPPEASIVWTDPITGCQGFLVIDKLVRGIASGGLRMRKGCSYDEVRGLAAAMSTKEVLHYDPAGRYVPMGGAKGGIDCDPVSSDAPGVLARFLTFIQPYLENNWATGDDLGTSAEMIDEALHQLGIDGCIAPVLRVVGDPLAARQRFTEACTVQVGGIGLADLVGGCGVAETALTALDRDGVAYHDTTAVIQGFGCMGGATARFLSEAGVRVVGIADAQGAIVNPNGLAVEDLLRHRTAHGLVDRNALGAEDVLLGCDSWLDIKADILIPAATSYSIDGANHHRVTARYIVEAANLPLTVTAEEQLAARGVVIVPDVVANSGTNAWWWWTLFGDVGPDAESSFDKVRKSLGALVTEVLDLADASSISPRQAARRIAETRSADLMQRLALG